VCEKRSLAHSQSGTVGSQRANGGRTFSQRRGRRDAHGCYGDTMVQSLSIISGSRRPWPDSRGLITGRGKSEPKCGTAAWLVKYNGSCVSHAATQLLYRMVKKEEK